MRTSPSYLDRVSVKAQKEKTIGVFYLTNNLKAAYDNNCRAKIHFLCMAS